MKKVFFLTALLTCCLVQLSAETYKANPLADPAAVVTSGKARFTVLTPRMIRIQYSAGQRFEDRATFAVINRRLPVPEFKQYESQGYLFIETSELTLRYKLGSALSPQLKSPANLRITFQLNGREVTWYPGKEDALNLKGTRRTLDGGSGDNYREDLEDGILSRAGWAVIDESPKTRRGDGSTTFAFDKQVDGIDWLAKPVDMNAQDWYFMGYGHDYKDAIGDYIKIAGRQPLPPLYALGYWYSKYQAYTQQDFIGLVSEMKDCDIPLDVMIFDMDWHLEGWTGWTWNKKLIANPVGLLGWMHQQDVKVGLNLHPADGVANYEDHFNEIRNDMSWSGDRVPWMLEDSTFYRSLFRRIIREREQQGVDFWWIDWQQNLTSQYTDGLGETFWCNHVFFNDMRVNRKDRRPFIFHRWGGLGSHRYPLGFSGDTYSTFGSLAFQPYFTATAANVCFGYWGHDLGGHIQIAPNNPELMLRWVQFGVFSPVFRTHGSSQENVERRIWRYDNFPLMLQSVQLRYQLMPYIYTAARQAYDTGISICRPLYYEWPEANEAYRQQGEYMFGDDILASPVVTPGDVEGNTFHKTWLPDGQWYDVCRNRMVSGNRTLADYYGQGEIPYFLRSGSIIVCNPPMTSLKHAADRLLLKVVPGQDGSTRLYEDAGDTQDYQDGAYATTTISQTRSPQELTVTIDARQGQYYGMPSERGYVVELLLEGEPRSVTVNGLPVSNWRVDESTGSLLITIPTTSCDAQTVLRVARVDTGIETVHSSQFIVQNDVYDLLGNKPSGRPRGVSIVRQTRSDGTKTVKKVVR